MLSSSPGSCDKWYADLNEVQRQSGDSSGALELHVLFPTLKAAGQDRYTEQEILRFRIAIQPT